MSMKKSAVLLACVGACALAVASPSSFAAPPATAQTVPKAETSQTVEKATALPVGDSDTALTSKSGEGAPFEPVREQNERAPERIVTIIV